MPTKEASKSMNNFKSIFKERFHQLRGDMSQDAFSNFLNISRPTVGFYENGDRLPDAFTLMKISKRCGVPSDWLLGLTDNRSSKNIEIGKETGLSDKAIEVLQLFNQDPSGQEFISTINFLLSQEFPDPYDVFDPNDETEKLYDKWKSESHITILRSISNYLSVKLDNDKPLEITEAGELRESYSGPGIRINYDSLLKSISKNEIIEKVLLLEIEEKLQAAKKQAKEGAMNGSD